MQVTISGGIYTSIIVESLRVHLTLNDEPDTASFTLKPGASAPTLFAPIVIGPQGTVGAPYFAGSVVAVSPRRLKAADSPFYDVLCTDWLRLFNRRTVNRIYYNGPGQSYTVSDLVINVIQLDTSGFSWNHVQASAVVEDVFTIHGETPGEILTRCSHLNGGGGWYIDTDRDVHFFGPDGDVGIWAPTAPATITDSVSTMLSADFRHTAEGRELRNRVIVNGRSTHTLVTVPNDYTTVGVRGIPLEESWMFGSTGVANIGAQVFAYGRIDWIGDTTDGIRPFATTTADAAPGATSIAVDSTAGFIAVSGGEVPIWIREPSGNVFSTWPLSPGTSLPSIPTPGTYGALTVPIAAGTILYAVDMFYGTVPADLSVGWVIIPEGETVRVRQVVNDTAAQTALAAIEGGDGVHEHPIDAPNADSQEAAEIGAADLALFAAATGVPMATWSTRDPYARPGVLQAFNLTGTDPFATTLMITRAELTWPIPDAAPLRRCEASNVKLPPLNMAPGPIIL